MLLPLYHDMLMWFVSLLSMISTNSALTGMNANSCARLLAPNIFTIEDMVQYHKLLPIVTSFCEVLIDSTPLD